MANFEMFQGPTPTQRMISQYVDQYNSDQRASQEQQIQRQQVAQQGQFQQGELNNLSDANRIRALTTMLLMNKSAFDAENVKYGHTFDTVLKPLIDSGDPQQYQKGIQIAQQMIQQDPNSGPFLAAAIARLKIGPLQGDLGNFQAQKFNLGQLTQANTSTSPEAQAYAYQHNLKAPMPSYDFAQAQATDLAGRPTTPDLTNPVPAPSADAVSNLEARASGAMPQAAQSLTAATGLNQTAMKVQGAKDVAKIKAGALSGPPGTGASLVQQVYKNPQSYFSLTPIEKKEYATGGGQPVNRISVQLQNRRFTAEAGLSVLNDVSGILDKWHQRGIDINGPMLGRYNKATQKWGGNILPTNLAPDLSAEYQGDISKLQEWLAAGRLQEAAGIVGYRPSRQVVGMLATPGIEQNDPRLKGAIDGMTQRLQQTVDQVDAAQWGGTSNIPLGARGGRYDARTEAGIANAMKHAGQTRNQVILHLKDIGAIPK